MQSSTLPIVSLVALIALCGCGSRPEKTTTTQATPGAAPPAEASARPPGEQPAATPPEQAAAPAPTPAAPAAEQVKPAEPVKPPEPAKPPEPKKYVLAVGTPISVRTVSEVNTKAVKSGNEFEATLEAAL